jgi:hypothetical protein
VLETFVGRSLCLTRRGGDSRLLVYSHSDGRVHVNPIPNRVVIVRARSILVLEETVYVLDLYDVPALPATHLVVIEDDDMFVVLNLVFVVF